METRTVINWDGYLKYIIVVAFFMLVVYELDINNKWYEAFVTFMGIMAASVICPEPPTKRVPRY